LPCDTTHVLAAVHDLHLLELVAETLRATLEDLATIVPDWVRAIAQPAWFEQYGRLSKTTACPKARRSATHWPSGTVKLTGYGRCDARDQPGRTDGYARAATPVSLVHVWKAWAPAARYWVAER
jgi:hypothetical protein